MKTAWEMAGKIAKNAPLAVYASKEACIKGLDLSLGEGLAFDANSRKKSTRQKMLQGCKSI